MKRRHRTRVMLSAVPGNGAQQLELFALLNLGFVQSLASGVLSPVEAVERFYHSENCLYVQKQLRKREAKAIMSHGVQLPDLFDSLSADEARREFYHELEKIRVLCLKILGDIRSRAFSDRAVA